MNIGPFHFSGEVSLGNLATMTLLLWNAIKYGNRITRQLIQSSERVDTMWAFHNKEMKVLMYRTDMIWHKFKFNEAIDEDERMATRYDRS
jgi:hypothetical protein